VSCFDLLWLFESSPFFLLLILSWEATSYPSLVVVVESISTISYNLVPGLGDHGPFLVNVPPSPQKPFFQTTSTTPNGFSGERPILHWF